MFFVIPYKLSFIFYPFRLRDDTFAFGTWSLSYEMLGDALSSAKTGSYRGVNDHNFVVDRKWADILLRGLIEDYYFNKSLANTPWGRDLHSNVIFTLYPYIICLMVVR